MLASTFLISVAPKPVAVRLCLGREIPSGPTGPWRSVMGVVVDNVLSRVLVAMVLFICRAQVEKNDAPRRDDDNERNL